MLATVPFPSHESGRPPRRAARGCRFGRRRAQAAVPASLWCGDGAETTAERAEFRTSTPSFSSGPVSRRTDAAAVSAQRRSVPQTGHRPALEIWGARCGAPSFRDNGVLLADCLRGPASRGHPRPCRWREPGKLRRSYDVGIFPQIIVTREEARLPCFAGNQGRGRRPRQTSSPSTAPRCSRMATSRLAGSCRSRPAFVLPGMRLPWHVAACDWDRHSARSRLSPGSAGTRWSAVDDTRR